MSTAQPEYLIEAVQKAAAEAREEAGLEGACVVTDFIIVAATRGFTADGEDRTGVVIAPHGPAYAMTGLLHTARVRFEAEEAAYYGHDEDD